MPPKGKRPARGRLTRGDVKKMVLAAIPTKRVTRQEVREEAAARAESGLDDGTPYDPAAPRRMLRSFSTLDQLVEALETRKHIVVVVGAGISVNCGIPDFRSADGVYKMAEDLDLGLTSPDELFDLEAFRRNPQPFYKFAPALYPGAHTPSATHRFLKLLQDRRVLQRVYTQNIDGLEEKAGIDRYVACHGSFASASCLACARRFSPDDIRGSVMAREVPRCPSLCGGLIKPNITFFGEKLGCSVSSSLETDRKKADLLLVIGTSLQVAPVSKILSFMPRGIPQILINRELVAPPSNVSNGFDVNLLGDCDVVVKHLVKQLGWKLPAAPAAAAAAAVAVAVAAGLKRRSNGGLRSTGVVEEGRNTYKFAGHATPGASAGHHHHGSGHHHGGGAAASADYGGAAEAAASAGGGTTAAVDYRTAAAAAAAAGAVEGGCEGYVAVGVGVGGSDSAGETTVEKVLCDGCDREIADGTPVHSCTDCFDYDLCKACFSRGRNAHTDTFGHGFRRTDPGFRVDGPDE